MRPVFNGGLPVFRLKEKAQLQTCHEIKIENTHIFKQ
jgi:hypothetical protein